MDLTTIVAVIGVIALILLWEIRKTLFNISDYLWKIWLILKDK